LIAKCHAQGEALRTQFREISFDVGIYTARNA
jgi:hypothetical protein